MRSSFVHPNMQQPTPVEEIEHPLERQSFREDVLNPLLQNLFAGVGAAILSASLATLAQVEVNPEVLLSIVGIVTGVLCILRFGRDEIRGIIFDVSAGMQSARNQEDIDRMRAGYEQQLDALRAHVASLEATVRKHNLKAETPINVGGVVGPQYSAAVKLLNRFFQRLDTSRSEVTRLKILNRKEWTQGMEFLRDAGVLDQRNKPLIYNYAEALNLLNKWATIKQRELGGS